MADAWDDFPVSVRQAIECRTGPIAALARVEGGSSSTVSALLVTSDRHVFVKAVKGISRPMRWLRNEITAGSVTPPGGTAER